MANSENGEKKWAGYSDYEDVAATLHDDINRAVRAYAHLDSKAKQNVGITPQTAIKTRSAILGITKKLHFEIRKNAHVRELREIHERWEGVEYEEGGGFTETGEAGYVARLESSDFTAPLPGFLGQLIDDIVVAGWELGYTKAGVEKPAAPESDEEQVKQMFE